MIAEGIKAEIQSGLSISLSLFALMIFLGCDSSPEREISGTVTLDGEPIESGEILFKPTGESQGAAAGSSIENGSYYVPAVSQGVQAGNQYRVEITSEVGKGKMVFNPEAPSGQTELLENTVPERYNVQSELRITISPDPSENTFNFDLTTSPGSL